MRRVASRVSRSQSPYPWAEPLLKHPLVLAVAAACGAIVIDRFEWLSPKGVCLCWLAIASGILQWRPRVAKLRGVFLLAAIFSILALGRHHLHWHHYESSDIGWLVTAGNHDRVTLQAILVQEPVIRSVPQTGRDPTSESRLGGFEESTTRLVLSVQAVRFEQPGQEAVWRRATGRLDGYVRGTWHSVNSGDLVLVSGRLRPIEPPRNPGQFDFQDYYRGKRQRVTLSVTSHENIEVLRRAPQSSLDGLRGAGREHFDAMLHKYLPPPQAALASAMLLGNRHLLEDRQQQRFVQTGTAHLLAISGLHVGILSSMAFGLLRLGWLPRNVCLSGVIVQVTVYAWLVHFNPPVTRAMILINLFCISRMLGHPGLSYNLLALAGLIVLAINPADLFNTGPQLSFLAVTTLIAIAPSQRGLERTAGQRSPLYRVWLHSRSQPIQRLWKIAISFRRSCLISTVLWLVTTPLIALRFHLVSWGGLIANPIVIPLTSGVLFGGLVVMLCGDYCPVLTRWGAIVCCWSLDLIDICLVAIEQTGKSSQWVVGPSSTAVAIFMCGYWWLLLNPWRVLRRQSTASVKNRRGHAIVSALVLWWLVGWIAPNCWARWQQLRPVDYAELTMIDVGHGTSVLLRTPGGKLILYDAGSFGSAHSAAQTISGVLWSLGINELDALVISHADLDHFNAAPELLRRFGIRKVFWSAIMDRQAQPAIGRLKKDLAEQQISLHLLSSGDQWKWDPDCRMEVLSPPSTGTGGDDNSDSLVLLVQMGQRRILLPGDLNGPGLTRLLTTTLPPVDFAMAPHHGSMGSRPGQFVQWCQAQWVAISNDSRRLSTRSKAAYSASGCHMASTAESGALRFRFSETSIEIYSWLPQFRWQPISTPSTALPNDVLKSHHPSDTRGELPESR